ncbi:MAG: translation initiation factor [Flavobacteriaceae bacterium]|nr:translation initiation factor [Flavobacteriaceae bacterium]
MAKPKKIGLEDLGGFVYSTNQDFVPPSQETHLETPENAAQRLEAHFSNKGRGGKTVTVIKGFVGTDEDLKALAKQLKNHCGVGGSVKEGEIIIQGNQREKIMHFLTEQGFRVKRVGG